MIKELPTQNQPQWLRDIAAGNKDFCLKNLLVDSLYYPACGLNGTPVKYLAGNVLSFVYTDIRITKEEYLDNLNGNGEDCGCMGYHWILQREIFREDIVPRGWWAPILPTEEDDILKRLEREERNCRPFGHWSVWQRNADRSANYGPELFSILYFGGEMAAIYQGLYNRLNIRPMILAIIQPGGGIDGGWDCDGSFFEKVVRANEAGMPRYLLCGGTTGDPGSYNSPYLREYRGERIIQLPERCAGLWRLANA